MFFFCKIETGSFTLFLSRIRLETETQRIIPQKELITISKTSFPPNDKKENTNKEAKVNISPALLLFRINIPQINPATERGITELVPRATPEKNPDKEPR